MKTAKFIVLKIFKYPKQPLCIVRIQITCAHVEDYYDHKTTRLHNHMTSLYVVNSGIQTSSK